MKLFLKTVLALALLLIILAVVFFIWAVARYPDWKRSSYVVLAIPGQTYRLPVRQYHMWAQPYNAKTGLAAFGFSLILPDLLPSTTDAAEAAKWGRGTGWHKELSVFLQYGVNTISQQAMANNYFESGKDLRKLFAENVYKYPPRQFKFLNRHSYTLQSNGCRKYEGMYYYGEIVLECGTGNSMWVTTCHTGGSSPYCNSRIKLDGKMSLSYSYGFNYVTDVVEIHNKLLQLLGSFRVQSQTK